MGGERVVADRMLAEATVRDRSRLAGAKGVGEVGEESEDQEAGHGADDGVEDEVGSKESYGRSMFLFQISSMSQVSPDKTRPSEGREMCFHSISTGYVQSRLRPGQTRSGCWQSAGTRRSWWPDGMGHLVNGGIVCSRRCWLLMLRSL